MHQWCWNYASTRTKSHVTSLNNYLDLQIKIVPLTVLLALRFVTSNGTKTHTISLTNHLNKMNVMVSLMTPLASCDRRHVMIMCVPKTYIPVKCHIHTAWWPPPKHTVYMQLTLCTQVCPHHSLSTFYMASPRIHLTDCRLCYISSVEQ